MAHISLLVIVVIITAVGFDFTNGFHDTAKGWPPQRVAGSVLGSGLGRRLAQVRWSVAGQMALAWILTLPSAATIGAVAAAVATRGTPGVVLIGLVTVAAAIALYAISRRAPVTARNVNDIPPVAVQREALSTAT
jgi:PiT family inorganic phosphate transporter